MDMRQQQIVENVNRHRRLILEAERWLWAHPQTGFTEWEAHGYMKEHFEALGYELILAGNIPANRTVLARANSLVLKKINGTVVIVR